MYVLVSQSDIFQPERLNTKQLEREKVQIMKEYIINNPSSV
jgi:hypothetical protein